MLGSEKFGDGWGWVTDREVLQGSLCPRKQSDVSGPGLGEAGRYTLLAFNVIHRSPVSRISIVLDLYTGKFHKL